MFFQKLCKCQAENESNIACLQHCVTLLISASPDSWAVNRVTFYVTHPHLLLERHHPTLQPHLNQKKNLIRFSLAHSVLGTHWHGVEPGQRCGRLVYNVVIHGLEGWRVWIPSKRLSMCKLRTLCKSFIICPIYKSLIIGHGRSRGNQWYFLWYVGVIEDWN